MFKSWVPIKEEDILNALDVVENTSFYIIEQSKASLSALFENNQDLIVKLLNFIKSLSIRRIHFAARGRSLYQGARTLAERMIQLGYNVVYPSLEQFIVYDPNATIVKGDVLIAFSTSGRTKKVVKKARFAKKVGCDIITITTDAKSPLARLAEPLPPIIFDYKINRDSLLENYTPKPFTPLGTVSEFIQLILSESLSTGLKEMQYSNMDEDKAFKVVAKTSQELLNKASENLHFTFENNKEELASFLANLILKYYSQQTVHFCARGKTFNMAVGPFKMRLDQIPNAFVTSILDFEPLNRPVRKGQITIAVSGTGMAHSIAKAAKDLGSMLISITSYENPLSEISDIVIMVPGRKKVVYENGSDWDIRQWLGWTSAFAPGGTSFEIATAALFDGVFAGLATYIGISEEQMKYGHANVE
ncbi:MAG: SIS domain-containing protein [Candidatus Asgardarchaeia archaeon]